MQSSKLGLQVWALATYLLNTGLKGQSSMKLHRDLKVTQKTAWHLAHRIRETWAKKNAPMFGPVEVGRNLHRRERKEQARSTRSCAQAVARSARRSLLVPRTARLTA